MTPPLHGLPTDLLDRAGTMLFVKDLDGRYVYASRAFGRALGREPAEIAGRSDRELLPPDAAAEIDGLIRLALAGGLPVEGRFVPPLRDGGRPLRLQVSPWRIEGRLAGSLGVASDEGGQAGAPDVRAFAARVGELGHDFNNALTTVLGLVDWHLMVGVPAGPLRDDLAKVRDAALHAETLARELVRLGREARGAPPAAGPVR